MRTPVPEGIRVTQEYGITDFYWSSGGYPTPGHLGMDYGSPSGTPLQAPAAGRILTVNRQNLGSGWGAYVQLEDGRYTHTMAHLLADKIRVAEGDQVGEGEVIGETGDTGWSTGAHLHWQVMDAAFGPGAMHNAIDPRHALNPDQYERDVLEDYAARAAERVRLDPDHFKRQINMESGWNIYAHSGANAIGLAQIVPRWHPGVNPWKPFASLDYAANLMASHLATFGRIDLALAAYNAGPGAVQNYGGVPPFPETQHYVATILDDWEAPTMPAGDDTVAEEIELNKWLKQEMEGIANDAIGALNRAVGGADLATLDDKDVNTRLHELRQDWPARWEAEKTRRAAGPR